MVEALRYAIAVQERTHARNQRLPDSDRILLRIGLHHDDVVAESGDLFGNGVNIASRICPQARPGGVCITQSVLEATRGRVTVETDDLGSPELKGIRAPIRLYGIRFKFDTPEPELPALPQDPLGPRIVERDGVLDLDPTVDPTDATAARDVVVRQLHAGVTAKAHAFSAQAQRLDNQPGWAGIAGAARAFANGLDCPTGALPERLGTIYSALMSLASFLDLDQRLRKADGHDIDPMAPDIRRMFDDLIRTSAPMLRRFPTIDALDEATSGFLTNPALFAPASAIVDAAKSGSVASPKLTAELSAMLTAGQRGGDVGDKAGTRGVRGVRNMLYRGGGLFAGFLLGATASGFANESPLIKRFGTFLATAEKDITQFLSDRSADIRHAFARMIVTSKGGEAPQKIVQEKDAGEAEELISPDRAISETFNLPAARRMLVAGQTLPEHWLPQIKSLKFGSTRNSGSLDLSRLAGLPNLRILGFSGRGISDVKKLSNLPHLTHLDLGHTKVADVEPLAKLNNLRELILWGSKVSDLTPLAGLITLRDLYLNGTKVSDVGPLAGLSALRRLYLNSTKVADIAPLARLSALQSLHLSDTPVSDIAPLAEISALQDISLASTLIRDIAPLAGLSLLQRLCLESTQVSDITPLAVLPELRTLSIGHTRVGDITALASVSTLQSLSLGNTVVSDLTPLSGLVALESLYLSRTQVGDIAPLAGLTALANLYLAGTRISDLTPVAGLTALERLDLSGTQVSDLAPLAGLTGLRFLDVKGSRVTDLTPVGKIDGLMIDGP